MPNLHQEQSKVVLAGPIPSISPEFIVWCVLNQHIISRTKKQPSKALVLGEFGQEGFSHDVYFDVFPILSAPPRHGWIVREIECLMQAVKVANHLRVQRTNKFLCLKIVFGRGPGLAVQDNGSLVEVGEFVVGFVPVVKQNWSMAHVTIVICDHGWLVDHVMCSCM
jgi:hypothetical protein